jgi:transcriptional regulator with XRE-family HTH domain
MPPHGTRLQSARESFGLSREKVAAELDVSARTIYRWEKGTTPVKRVVLYRLAELYHVPVDALLEEEVAA